MAEFLEKVKTGVDSAGSVIGEKVTQVKTTVGHMIDEHWSSAILDNFKSGNIIQLVSRSSGKTLQVTENQGRAVVDGSGPEGPDYKNAQWCVLNDGNNIVRLYNGDKFLAITNGQTQITPFADPSQSGTETRFRLSQMEGQFVTMESVDEMGSFVGILSNGQLKPAIDCTKELDSQFSVKLVVGIQQ